MNKTVNVRWCAAVLCVVLFGCAQLTATEIVVDISADTSLSAWLAANGITPTVGDTVLKKGMGTLTGGDANNTWLGGMTVEKGRFHPDANSTLGASPSLWTVKDGGSIHLNGARSYGASKTFVLEGDGCGEGSDGTPSGALTISGNGTEPCSSCAFQLSGDATIGAMCGNSGLFTMSIFYLNGHTLTMRGPKTGNAVLRFRYGSCGAYGTGTVLLDAVSLGSSANNFIYLDSQSRVCKLVNGAEFMPGNQPMATMFSVIDCEAGTCINGDRFLGVALDLLFSNVVGVPKLGNALSKFTLTGSYVPRSSDLMSGAKMSAASTQVVFADGCFFDVSNEVALAAGRYEVVHSDVGIVGVPEVHGEILQRGGSLELSDDGKTLTLVVPTAMPTEGAVNVCSWGVLPGTDGVGNAARFNAEVAKLTGPAEVWFPNGTYVFDGPLALEGLSDVRLCGDGRSSTIVMTDRSATAAISASGCIGLAISNLVVSGASGFSGVALSATACPGLSTGGLFFKAIPGGVERSPIVVADSADVNLGASVILDNAVYAAQASLVGTSTAVEGSEPQTSRVTLYVGPGETLEFADAFPRWGHGAFGDEAFPEGGTLVKIGPGVLVSTNVLAGRLDHFRIEEGVLESRVQGDLSGAASACNSVLNGGTLFLHSSATYNTSYRLLNQALEIAGTGADGWNGALVVGDTTSYEIASGITFVLNEDATIYLRKGSLSGVFSLPHLDLRGNTLTVEGVGRDSCEFRIRQNLEILSKGTLRVKNARLTSSDLTWVGLAGEKASLRFEADSRFIPEGSRLLTLFDECVFEYGAQFTGVAASTPFTVETLTGAPDISANVCLTVGKALKIRADDVLADQYLTSINALQFAQGATLQFAGGTADAERYALAVKEDSSRVLKVAHSDNGFTGRLRNSGTRPFGWGTCIANGGNDIVLSGLSGMVLMLR